MILGGKVFSVLCKFPADARDSEGVNDCDGVGDDAEAVFGKRIPEGDNNSGADERMKEVGLQIHGPGGTHQVETHADAQGDGH